MYICLLTGWTGCNAKANRHCCLSVSYSHLPVLSCIVIHQLIITETHTQTSTGELCIETVVDMIFSSGSQFHNQTKKRGISACLIILRTVDTNFPYTDRCMLGTQQALISSVKWCRASRLNSFYSSKLYSTKRDNVK